MFSHLHKSKSTLLLPSLLLVSAVASAAPKEPSTMSNPLAQVLVFIMVLLLLAIAILGNVVNNATSVFRDKLRKQHEEESKGGHSILSVAVITACGLLYSIATTAQATVEVTPAPEVPLTFNGLSAFTFFLMVGIIAAEIVILIALIYQLKFLVGIERRRVVHAKVEAKPKTSWWWRINKAVSVEEEEAIDLSHDYDGISELDNKLPPWWIAAFTLTILFSVAYLYRYHVAHSAPLMIEELEISMKKAEVEKAAYLAKSASNVDENTVRMLDAAGIAAGKNLFAANCIACHGSAGEGNTVGPNLTDNYWLNGGKINDVFRTIKYGVVEKGMRSWKDDFSPVQLAQLASFVKSIGGTNPPNAKEPQGDLFEEGAGSDTAVTDSTANANASK